MGEQAPDGSPVALYLALPGDEEAAIVHGAVTAGAPILELGCGAGRVTRPLAALGHTVTAVDNSSAMLDNLRSANRIETVLADITTLDLSPRRWPAVVAASHLVNDALGTEFLAAASRHVASGGAVLVERHPPGWIASVEPFTTERSGVAIALTAIDRPDPNTLRATMVYGIGDERYEQPFTAYDVDDTRLAAIAADAGLRIDSMLDDEGTWVRLVAADPPT